MVVGLLISEWHLLVERQGGSERTMQMITGVEEAVVRGLSQSEGTPDAQPDLKVNWNLWALKLCEGSRCGPAKASALAQLHRPNPSPRAASPARPRPRPHTRAANPAPPRPTAFSP